jgi:RNA-directed DNA polymerase
MKRINGLYQQLHSMDALQFADRTAQKGKAKQKGVIRHNNNADANLLALQSMLKDKTYKTSGYSHFKIRDPKERIISSLPFFPDRIAHHDIMQVLEPVLIPMFTADTYSCIKGRGLHGASYKIRKCLKDKANTRYCLKLDIQQFYPSINHDALKAQLARKFKNKDLLNLLGEIIDSSEGVPIGSLLSQFLANLNLTPFDHWIKEEKQIRYYFRYCDDMVIFGSTKAELHQLLAEIRVYLSQNLGLTVKHNYQVFPVATSHYSKDGRGIDFLGYVFYREHVRLRKSIKQRCFRKQKQAPNVQSIASYKGWMIHCNAHNLMKKLKIAA